MSKISDIKSIPQRMSLRWAGIAGLLFFIVVGIKWGYQLPQHLDILFGDEAEYMRNGLDLFEVIRNDWGPTYNIWYKFLSLFTSDTITLYYANYIAGAVLTGGLLMLVLLALRLSPPVALYASFCFFVSGIQMNTWPRISHFVLLLLCGAILVFSRIRSAALRTLVIAIACYWCAYARPDLMLAFFLMLAVAAWLMYQERAQWRSFLPALLVLLLSVLFFQGIFGQPSATYKGGLDRLYSAFCQHYAINYKFMTNADFDAVTEWIDFCRTKFPDCYTIGDVLKNHPQEFIQHVLFNVKNYLLLLFSALLSLLFPLAIIKGKKGLLLAIGLLLLLLFATLFNKEKRNNWMALLKEHRLLLLLLAIFGLPSMGMSWVIFPRPHYMLLHLMLPLLLLTLLLQVWWQDRYLPARYFMVLLVLLALAAPTAGKYPYLQYGQDMQNHCSQRLIRFLEKKKDQPYVVFTNYLNVTYMLPKNFSEFSTEFELKKGMSFGQIMKDKKINIVLVSSNILQNPMLKSDTTWQQLIANPETLGFEKVRYSDACESYLLMKE